MANPFRFRYSKWLAAVCDVGTWEESHSVVFSQFLVLVTLPCLFFASLCVPLMGCYEITYDGHDHELQPHDYDAIFLFAPLVCKSFTLLFVLFVLIEPRDQEAYF